MWGTPTAVCAIRHGLISMHAASVDVDGAALLLAAPGTYGKTTLAGGFLKAGYRLLSDDMVCFRLSPQPEVLPGPAVLRLRRDVFENLEFPGISRIHRFGRKFGLVLDDATRGNAQPVPLAGIVLLRKSGGSTALTRVQSHDAFRDLFALSLNGIIDHGRSFQDLAALVSRVPVWNLERKLDYAGLTEAVETLVRACLRH